MPVQLRHLPLFAVVELGGIVRVAAGLPRIFPVRVTNQDAQHPVGYRARYSGLCLKQVEGQCENAVLAVPGSVASALFRDGIADQIKNLGRLLV